MMLDEVDNRPSKIVFYTTSKLLLKNLHSYESLAFYLGGPAFNIWLAVSRRWMIAGPAADRSRCARRLILLRRRRK